MYDGPEAGDAVHAAVAAVPRCPNCGTPVNDRYCPGCGQRNTDRLVSLGTLVRDVLEDQLSLEARLPRTLGTLFGRPGALTAEYIAGRVARYIPPFRLYFVAGLIFFLTISVVASFEAQWDRLAEFTDAVTGMATEGATVVVVNIPIDTARVPAPLLPFARRYVQQEARLNALPPREAARILYGGTLRHASAVMLLLVPGFALLLKALYRRRLYIAHVVFILHLHAAVFLIALLPLLAPVARIGFTVAVILWAAGYLYLAMRRVYGESIVRTAAKFAVLLVMYNVALAGVLLTIIALTVVLH